MNQRSINKIWFPLLAATLLATQTIATAADAHWVATWSTAIETTQGGDLPPVPLADKTLRQYVRTSIPAKGAIAPKAGTKDDERARRRRPVKRP